MQFQRISKAYGQNCIFDEFSLEITKRTILSVVGPSGEGKTTLLQIAAGLIQPDSGIVIKEVEEEGSISYLFQEPRLLPFSTVFTNVELALRSFLSNKKEREESALHYLRMVGLADSMGLYPDQLSGGMRQRVAIARAFAHPSKLMLLDEPFQSLDIKLKVTLVNSFLRLWEESPRTTLFVTHDPKEAILLGDAVCCLGDPKKPLLYQQIHIPRNARNIGDQTLLALEASLVQTLVGA
ncbi:ABC transporter ATP-binding protein [Sphaerochaeta globosa]|uniref:Fe(3+)-transporting ATPase n=1 Tax=Sphaerochaeta globosa (strain ATCC BAA-1886 / DSM 22777 / Buddy) TaxID=158189 RepID=F0RWY9_SPHGB|nr:ABC transporter ATP-binding protein [Sphaerochaeta globosa]ADY13770.1 Fe(3+)-transporting ATPase [Sphaerochaeta globosa str. Buddy]